MKLDVSPEEYEALRRVIASDDSPVGIDATKTHVIILKKLLDIEARLGRMEERLERSEERA